MDNKKCSKCSNIFPLSKFCFIKTKNKYCSHCDTCREAYNKDNHKTYKLGYNTRVKKVCNGFYCRGELNFISIGGARYCKQCTNYKNSMEDWQ